MLLTTNATSDTLSTYATTQTIYWKFGTTFSAYQFEVCAGKSE